MGLHCANRNTDELGRFGFAAVFEYSQNDHGALPQRKLVDECPQHEVIVDAVLEESNSKAGGCVGVLFDTYAKQGRSLWEWISRADLKRHADALHQGGRIVALAGSLGCDKLDGLPMLEPDIVAIRSAACKDGVRNGVVVKDAVSAFRTCLKAAAKK